MRPLDATVAGDAPRWNTVELIRNFSGSVVALILLKAVGPINQAPDILSLEFSQQQGAYDMA